MDDGSPRPPPPVSAETVFVALGSNLGDRAAHLAAARDALARLPGTRIVALSDVEETAPLGPPGQGAYLNQMVAVDTTLDPDALLSHLHRIEQVQGRVRGERWGPRTLDLDIVRFGDRRIASADLTVPHPGLRQREFWQRELAQVTGRLVRPVSEGSR